MSEQQHNTNINAQANDRAVREARAIYQRVLAGWAMDVLELRREGLDKPSLRDHGHTLPMTPSKKAA